MIESAQRAEKKPVGAKESVQPDLQYFNINDDETGIDQEMHDRNGGVAKHFFLSEGQQ